MSQAKRTNTRPLSLAEKIQAFRELEARLRADLQAAREELDENADEAEIETDAEWEARTTRYRRRRDQALADAQEARAKLRSR